MADHEFILEYRDAIEIGATGENRTPDQPFTRGQLYQLSYGGFSCSRVGFHDFSLKLRAGWLYKPRLAIRPYRSMADSYGESTT